MNNHDLLDKIKEAMDDKVAEVEALGHRVAQAEEELEKLREITATQKSQSDAQIERMEKELGRMRSSLGESVQLMVQREMAVNIEYVPSPLKKKPLFPKLGLLTVSQIRTTPAPRQRAARRTAHGDRAHAGRYRALQAARPALARGVRAVHC